MPSQVGQTGEAALLASIRTHVLHHLRFYVALAIGLAAWAAGDVLHPLRLLVAGDAFFLTYLASTAWHARHITPAALRERASYEDEGIAIIVAVTLAVIVFCLVAIFTLLAQQAVGRLQLAIALANVPLGWATLHTVAAFRYAHAYYAEAPDGPGARRDAGGLIFPGCELPGIWDFLYHAFVVGMTAQVADVQVSATPMRRLVLLHGVVAFFFNAIILALAVNVAFSAMH
jgi:uncharacterized membrane protein